MEKRTINRKKHLQIEYEAYLSDMEKLPRNQVTSRGYPFWDTHEASKLLEEDEESGKAKMMKPMELWKSRKEYQNFPLILFRKHIHSGSGISGIRNLLKEWQVNKVSRDFSKLTF